MEYEFCGTHLIAEGYFLNYDDLNNINLFLELLLRKILNSSINFFSKTFKNIPKSTI